jgi:hypothetical protein
MPFDRSKQAFRGEDLATRRTDGKTCSACNSVMRKYVLLARMDEIEAAAVLAKRRTESREHLRFRVPREVLLKVNREAPRARWELQTRTWGRGRALGTAL